MSQHIQAIYENGLLRPLVPLDLPENSVVEIDVRDVPFAEVETIQSKGVRILREAGLVTEITLPVTEKDILTPEERQRLGKLLSGERSIGNYIDEDRESRG